MKVLGETFSACRRLFLARERCLLNRVRPCSRVDIAQMLNPKLPFIPGMDLCGVVEQIAEGSDKFKVQQ